MKPSVFAIALFLVFSSNAFAQRDPSVTIDGEVTKSLKLSVADLKKFPPTEVKTKDRDGKEHVYKGTLLSVVLDSAGVTLGKDLRGENLVKYVRVKAADGYKVVYSLAEIDPGFTSNTILLATQVDGKPLPKGEGPFRIIAPLENRPTRWAREVTSITVIAPKD
ncbi:MAG TPA: molybdopterin-dependent oxidoreductase [Cyclobacteriaceae bacterium]|nr:molybdopterin-dependent oxidoreductase [Cyclobacteriaceae bacterium]